MGVSTMIKMLCEAVVAGVILLAGCGPTAEEQHAADQQQCSDFGYQAGTDAFANCMMKLDSKREAQAAADRRAQQAEQAAKDKAAQDG
jgi:hypothetical protein